MPRYVYHCSEHGELEIDHSISECDVERTCPHCGVVIYREIFMPYRAGKSSKPGSAEVWERSAWKAEQKFKKKRGY